MTHNKQLRMFKAQLQVREHEMLGIFPKLKYTVKFIWQCCLQGHAISKLTFITCADLKTIHQPSRKGLPEENTARPLPSPLQPLTQLNSNQDFFQL